MSNCPHCTSPIPPEFASMPICSICGGDLKSAPASPVWASVDIRKDNTRSCPSCSEPIKSILAMECPKCHASLAPAGEVVQDIEKEKQKFEDAVKSSNTPPPQEKPAPVPTPTPKPEPVQVKAEPVREPEPERKESPSMKDKAKQKEGFFGRLLRILGLKK